MKERNPRQVKNDQLLFKIDTTLIENETVMKTIYRSARILKHDHRRPETPERDAEGFPYTTQKRKGW